MKLNEAREHFYTFSGTLSNVNRQLCFAGIAVVWIFTTKAENGAYSLPSDLLIPLWFFVGGLALDLLHYIAASASWGIFHWIKEKSNSVDENSDFLAPGYINWLPNFFFWSKTVCTLIGYGLLLKVFTLL